MFKCARCGVCCQNVVQSKNFWFGLFLLPEEKDLFPAELVEPYWAVKGTMEVKIFQLNTKKCPHQTEDNQCRIYDKRPTICRAHPLTIHRDPLNNKIVGASLDVKCPSCKGLIGIRASILDVFPREIAQAALEMSLVCQNTFTDGNSFMIFDLKTRSWIELTKKTAADIYSPFLKK